MQTQLEKLEGSTAVLAVSLTADEVEGGVERAYRRLVQRVNIPGFRKGKAPRPVLERHVGRAGLLEEAVDILIPEGYQRAVDDAGVEPIDRPHAEVLEHPSQSGVLRFKVTVAVKPAVELGDYRGARDGVPREEPEVTPEDVDAQLEQVRERLAVLEAVEGAAVEKGHFVVCDIKILGREEPAGAQKADKAVKAGAGKDNGQGLTVEVGAGALLPGIEDALVGLAPGESREAEVEFPAGHPNKNLAGRRLPVRVTAREIKRKVLPALDDELARRASSLQTLQELKDDLANKLLRLARARARREYEDRVVQAVVDQARLEAPGVLVESGMDAMWRERLRALSARGVTFEQYLASTGKPEPDLREELRLRADAAVRRELVLEAIAKKEGLQATPADLEREAERLAEVYEQPADAVKKALLTAGDLDATRDAITHRKTIAFLAHGSPDEAWPAAEPAAEAPPAVEAPPAPEPAEPAGETS